jgi:hypothetical protein
MEDKPWRQLIHKPCGLPVEFCVCPNAPFKTIEEYDEYERGGAKLTKIGWMNLCLSIILLMMFIAILTRIYI